MGPTLVKKKNLSSIVCMLIIYKESDLAEVVFRSLSKFKPLKFFNPTPLHLLTLMYISFLFIVLFAKVFLLILETLA